MSDGYDASSLTYLEGLEAVRKRPGMYIGSTDSRGLQHCMWEIIDNAVDEALAGHCTRIEVTLHADRSISVSDNGRGIPVDVEKRTGLPGVVLVFTKLHAGGKFGDGGYKVSGGLHGVGASVVNALSSRLDVEVDRGGTTHTISFCRGEAGAFDKKGDFTPGGAMRSAGKARTTGTRVRYWADEQIFLPGAEVDLDATYARARQTAFLVPGLEIVVRDDRGDDEVVESFRFDGGVADFVEYLAADPAVAPAVIISGSGTFTETVPVLEDGKLVTADVERECEVEVALRWGTGYDAKVSSFVNIVATPKGGTHVTGFERALSRTLGEAAKTMKALRANEEGITKDDCLEGLTAIVAVKLAEPQFEGQTKEILGTAAAAQIVSAVVSEQLRDWLATSKNKRHAKTILDKAVGAARTRRALRTQRETIRRKNALESSSLPAKLADCHSNDLEMAEVILVEGDSAMGTAKSARDSDFQALLPLRGKILNVLRATEAQMLNNTECQAIISAVGAGSGKTFDLEQIRYGKVILLSDADVDGSHIRCLLLTLFFRYMRPMLDEGRIYSAVPPLYRITVKGTGEHRYAYSDEDRDRVIADIRASGKEIRDDIQRYKGLGEMDADQLADTTLDVHSRKLRRITVEDAEAMSTLFDVLMGNDPSARREFITENTHLLDPSRLDV